MSGVVEITSPSAFVAQFAAWDGVELALSSPRAQPPGARLEGALDGALLRLKVHRCRKRDDGEFLVVGRPLDLRRETRAALEALAGGSPERARVDRW